MVVNMNEIKVVYEPRKQVIIHEYSKYGNPEEFIRQVFAGVPASAILIVHWVDGVVLSFTPFSQTDTVVKELINGTLHWDHVSFAPMPKFMSKIIADGTTCNVADVSTNAVFKAIAEFLKKEFLK
jgi:hypothetical protein